MAMASRESREMLEHQDTTEPRVNAVMPAMAAKVSLYYIMCCCTVDLM